MLHWFSRGGPRRWPQAAVAALLVVAVLVGASPPLPGLGPRAARAASRAPRGDADGSGVVDKDDAGLVARYLAGLVEELPFPESADATQDGRITVEDALAIAQRLEGKSRAVTAGVESGAPGGPLTLGSVVRIQVCERFFPFAITGGTVRVTSASSGYDSGESPLFFERDGRSLYWLWMTRGLPPAADYEVRVAVAEADPPPQSPSPPPQSRGPDLVLALGPRWYEPSYLAGARDAWAPAPGLPLEFRRVFPQGWATAPCLGPLGRGWVHNYDLHLVEFTDGRVFFFEPGRARWFESRADGTYTASPGDQGVLTRDADGAFQLLEKSGLTYRFRADLRLDCIQDPNRNRITCLYDGGGRLVEVRHSCGQRFRLEYNQQGRVAALVDQVGRRTAYQYSADGLHLLRVTAPGGRVTSYTYSLGQGEASDHRLLSIAFPDGTHRFLAYDALGRLQSQEGDGGAGRTSYSYDADGATRLGDATGGVTVVRVDDAGRPVEVTDPLGGVSCYEYDARGYLVRVTDPRGCAAELAYDARGNAVRALDPLGGALDLAYDAAGGKVAEVRDGRGAATSFAYDSRGNLARIAYPDGSMAEFAYDSRGCLSRARNRAGETTVYEYDDRGLILSRQGPGGEVATFTYDAAGNLTSAANAAGRIAFQYDGQDRLTSATYPGGRSFRYEYDAAGKRTRMTDPDGRVTAYEYDAAGLLARVVDQAGRAAVEYRRDAAGRVTRRTLGNGAYATYEYDAAGRVLGLTNLGPGGDVISRFAYTYDAAGNCVSRGTLEGREDYEYDALGRLARVTRPGGEATEYIYDAAGNRLAVCQGPALTEYAVNELDQYAAAGAVQYAYDANGNLASRTEGGETTWYDYDCSNRLVGVRAPGGQVTYTYDALGARCARTDAGGTVRWLWDGPQVAVEEDEAHRTMARYMWGAGLDEAVRMDRDGAACYYALDALGSVADLLDASGNVVEHYGYDAFGVAGGEVEGGEAAPGNPWRFTGLEYDPATGLQYSRSRYYSPGLGRFISPDPLGPGGGLNLYAYVGNSPLNYTDPSGELWGALFLVGLVVLNCVQWAIGLPIDTFGSQSAWTGHEGVSHPFGQPEMSFGWSGWPIEGGEAPSALSNPFGSGASYGAGGYGGGICPTFIQLPAGTEAPGARSTHLDVSGEELAAAITVPSAGCLLRSDIPIFGVAGGTGFESYRVEYGEGADPAEWRLIAASETPQSVTDVGLADIPRMQGDIDIRGNLATWNTGLKNWFHLPWHPPEDPTDLNGLYTLRLAVAGREGRTVEDRMTVEVGRCLAQCLPGVARSADGRVVMRFPEQALAYPFRVYSILPAARAAEIGEPQPPPPEGLELLGPAYRIREPGDRFMKDVALEFTAGAGELGGRDPGRCGILRYDAAEGRWLWLPTDYQAEPGGAVTFRALLQELAAPRAIYALGRDPGEARSQPRAPDPPPPAPLAPVSPGVLLEEDFEQGTGTWQARDRWVGGVPAVEAGAGPDGSAALRVENQSAVGDFAVTVLDRPFDASQYSAMSFDYRLEPGVQTDFYLLVAGRWYNLGFSGDPVDFDRRDVNIGHLGRLEGVARDGRWHSAAVDLGRLLRSKTRHTQVDTIVMADWGVGGYMKLEFGRNARGAAYYIDNFRLASGAGEGAPAVLRVDDFEAGGTANLLGGPEGTFSNTGQDWCQAAVVAAPGASSGANRALELTYDAARPGAYCGYWTALMGAGVEGLEALSLRVCAPPGAAPGQPGVPPSSEPGIPPLLVGLRHAAGGAEARVPLEPYLGPPGPGGWRQAVVPLSAFVGRGLPGLSPLDTLFFTFEEALGSRQGRLLVDDLQFVGGAAAAGGGGAAGGGAAGGGAAGGGAAGDSASRVAGAAAAGPSAAVVADFDRYPLDYRYNLRGGGYSTVEKGAAAISAGYHRDGADPARPAVGAVRISYGGSIGLDYGQGAFSYALWETGLMGLDARGFGDLVLTVRGQAGGERFNVWLDDGTTRRCLRAGELAPVTASWQEVRLPLQRFAAQGVDLSHLEALQVAFEWEAASGTVYLSEIRFEGR